MRKQAIHEGVTDMTTTDTLEAIRVLGIEIAARGGRNGGRVALDVYHALANGERAGYYECKKYAKLFTGLSAKAITEAFHAAGVPGHV